MASKQQTRDQHFAMITLWKQSGQSQKQFCLQNNIAYHIFHYWYKRYRNEQSNSSEPAFIPLNVKPSFSDATCANIEVVLADGKRILFHQPVSTDFLKAVIS